MSFYRKRLKLVIVLAVAIAVLLLIPSLSGAAEPALPAGLGGQPPLPTGLSEPALPTGLDEAGGEEEVGQARTGRDGLPAGLSGFAESRAGLRTRNDPDQKARSIFEARLKLQWAQDFRFAALNVTADLIYDDVVDEHDIALERGEGWLDLREVNLLFRPADSLDLKLGRQVLTWGTGDLLFINDLFPKDWNAFFIGRDDEYLKAPSDAFKLAFFNTALNVDLIYTPRFDSDRYIDGNRISFFNPANGTLNGNDNPMRAIRPDDWFEDDEIALRAYRNLGSWEAALYAYDGYWKSPGGQDTTGGFVFPRLRVGGASVRGPLAAGIANAEIGYYDSREDAGGDDPFIRNSEWRLLLGYEQELAPELTGAVQWYLEHMVDHGAYKTTLPAGAAVKVQDRQVLTLRLTRLLMNQNLMLSLFNYYSPSQDDGYLRLKANYKLTDAWQVEAGGNLFHGERPETFFGQFETASNVYFSLRFGF